jgi:hypothetical protein
MTIQYTPDQLRMLTGEHSRVEWARFGDLILDGIQITLQAEHALPFNGDPGKTLLDSDDVEFFIAVLSYVVVKRGKHPEVARIWRERLQDVLTKTKPTTP